MLISARAASVILTVCLASAARAESPVPRDPYEPVVDGASAVSSPADRSAALFLIERARQNSLIHQRGSAPYRFTATFNADGNVQQTGSGELTETWVNGQKWMWTASLGGVSHVRVGASGRLYENEHVAVIPMRAHMLRNEIFWGTRDYPLNAGLRKVSVQINGKAATCLLASPMPAPTPETGARLWREEEFCIDDASGLLLVHSIAPGTYAMFGYGANQEFHGRTLPDHISIYVAGALAVDSSFSIADPDTGKDSLLTPAPGMTTQPPPVTMQLPMRIFVAAPGSLPRGASEESVLVHAEIDGEGHLVEEELSATADPALTQTALDFVRKMTFNATGSERQDYVEVMFYPGR